MTSIISLAFSAQFFKALGFGGGGNPTHSMCRLTCLQPSFENSHVSFQHCLLRCVINDSFGKVNYILKTDELLTVEKFHNSSVSSYELLKHCRLGAFLPSWRVSVHGGDCFPAHRPKVGWLLRSCTGVCLCAQPTCQTHQAELCRMTSRLVNCGEIPEPEPDGKHSDSFGFLPGPSQEALQRQSFLHRAFGKANGKKSC